ERDAAQVIPVEIEQIEDDVADRIVLLLRERVLQRAEVAPPAPVVDDDLSVEPRSLHRERRERPRDRAELPRPVVALAREEARLLVVEPREDAVAVELDLVQP